MSRSSPASAAGPARSSPARSTTATRPRRSASSTRSAICPRAPRRQGGSMSSRFPAELVLLSLLLAGCGRETRDYRSTAMNESARAAAFEGNAWHIAQGQRLFAWMNCSGCHSHGGGGMGPPLMDEEWRYGGTMPEIAATILDGRPGGMPAFRGRITEDQAWQLAAFVRTLSSQTRHDMRPSRADEPANIPPLDLQRPKPIRPVTPAEDQRSVP